MSAKGLGFFSPKDHCSSHGSRDFRWLLLKTDIYSPYTTEESYLLIEYLGGKNPIIAQR